MNSETLAAELVKFPELIWDTGGFLILQLLDLIIDTFNGWLTANNGTWEGTEHSYVLETGG